MENEMKDILKFNFFRKQRFFVHRENVTTIFVNVKKLPILGRDARFEN